MEISQAIKTNQATINYVYADLVDEYSDSVYKFCRSITYSREDADDLFQETFFQAFKQLSKINDSNNPQGFLFSTSIYIWKSWKRKYARRKRLVPVEPLDETIASSINIEDCFIEQEEIRIVRELVEYLPEKFKIPIVLYYTIEMSISEIAVTLKIPSGTVKSRLFKARKLIEKGLVDLL